MIWIVGADGLLGATFRRMVPHAICTTKKEADVTDLAALYAFVKKHPEISRIINCSAFSLVDLAEKEQTLAHAVNALGPENLGKVANSLDVTILHVSTDYVFEGNLPRPLHEQDETRPVNFYGKTKLEGEQRLLDVCPKACVVRTSALFGVGGKNFVASLLTKFQGKDRVLLANDQWNSPTFAPDLARAMIDVLDCHGIFHFSNSGAATKFTFGEALYQAMSMKNQELELVSVPCAFFAGCCNRPAYSVFDTSKIGKILSFPIRSWQEALNAFMRGEK
jgi:dTDP-4-dehydrorhamnose reductase